MHEIDKVHRADLGAVSAATLHCRSYVARRNPRSGNSCGVGGRRQLNIYGQGALVNGKETILHSTERKAVGVAGLGMKCLYMHLVGLFKEHIFWFLVTFSIFCAWTDTGINSTHTHKILFNQLSIYSPLTMQAHNLATSTGVNCPACNFLRDTNQSPISNDHLRYYLPPRPHRRNYHSAGSLALTWWISSCYSYLFGVSSPDADDIWQSIGRELNNQDEGRNDHNKTKLKCINKALLLQQNEQTTHKILFYC